MKDLYEIAGISKQAFHQGLNRELIRRDEQKQLGKILQKLRHKHPRMSCRQMYWMLRPKYMGRDRFEQFCYGLGFKVPVKRSFHKTTDSLGVNPFPNLIMNMESITSIDQVWVSDITYYRIGDRFYYITLITDLYSRRIVGYNASGSLKTEDTTLKALKMAIIQRKIKKKSNLVLHSDGGGQYYSKKFIQLTSQYDIRNSMSDNVFENPHAERINGTVKNNYLIPWSPKNLDELNKMLAKAVYLYNTEKPHSSLDRCTPEHFEHMTCTGLLTKSWIINKRKKEAKKEKVNISMKMV